MNKPAFSVLFSAFSLCLVAVGCSSSSDDGDSSEENGGSGGDSGARTGGTGGSGAQTGGASTGGSSTTGGASTGGASTGGAATGGSATGGAGGGSGGCDAACARVIGAACGTTTQAECVEGCNSLLTTACAEEVPPYTECVSNPANAITCDTTAMTASIAGCDDVIRDLGVCGICLPDATDMACGTCTRGTCCEELQAYAGAADVAVFDMCVTPCEDTACVDTCAAASPIAGAAYAAVADCQIGSCGEECVCEASTEDTTCVACLKTGCCSDLVPYATAPDVPELAACIEPCADQLCVDDCISQFPEAGNAYDVLIGCAESSCATECSQ